MDREQLLCSLPLFMYNSIISAVSCVGKIYMTCASGAFVKN